MIVIDLIRNLLDLAPGHIKEVQVKVYNPFTEQYEPITYTQVDKKNKILYIHSDIQTQSVSTKG